MKDRPRENHIHVACAIIEREGLVLAAQRKAGMRLALKWEFPGGRIEPGESAEECLRRELMEEMGIQVSIGRSLDPVTHEYSFFTVTLYPFVCAIISGEIALLDHAAISWLPAERLPTLDWAEADLPLIENYVRESKRRDENN